MYPLQNPDFIGEDLILIGAHAKLQCYGKEHIYAAHVIYFYNLII